ncbi:hypothetical protein PMG11_11164 [Penicillium brasilianum]|uniref:Uncharacterized protein n=1 Tax=Penicillium brasilianum TaxID=104259 RepID=A0A0F7U4L0_PENBI|nr:hypothetical protein PMG11_11164 [Penicillium brasilianum]
MKASSGIPIFPDSPTSHPVDFCVLEIWPKVIFLSSPYAKLLARSQKALRSLTNHGSHTCETEKRSQEV